MLPRHLGGYAVSQLWRKTAANKAIQPSWSEEKGRMFMETSADLNGVEQVMDSSGIQVVGDGGEGRKEKQRRKRSDRKMNPAKNVTTH